MPIVDYASSSSSSDNDGDSKSVQPEAVTVIDEPARRKTAEANSKKRKRGLPKLPVAYRTDNPRDDPKDHQGRTRSQPYVDGDYFAHVYIALSLPRALRRTINDVVSHARRLCPDYTLHPLVIYTSKHAEERSVISENGRSNEDDSPGPSSLHISLTHPLPLRRSQIDTFRDGLRSSVRREAATLERPLTLSFAGQVVGFVNGRRYGGDGTGGRAFLALRIAAGATELEKLLDRAIHPILAKLHLPRYHSNPQFHASFAWCLVPPPSGASNTADEDRASTSDDIEDNTPPRPASTPFTAKVLEELSQTFGQDVLRAQPEGGWQLEHLELKVGKDIHFIPLA